MSKISKQVFVRLLTEPNISSEKVQNPPANLK